MTASIDFSSGDCTKFNRFDEIAEFGDRVQRDVIHAIFVPQAIAQLGLKDA